MIEKIKNTDCSKFWRAKDAGYVGGYYAPYSDDVNDVNGMFDNTVADMMLALADGPITVGLEPPMDFMSYLEGIYDTDKATPVDENEWVRVDHAVLLVGYGEENGVKFWKVQISWGNLWGEEGFFRIKMGSNTAGIESIAEVTDVVQDCQAKDRILDLLRGDDQKPSFLSHKTQGFSG